MIQFQVTIRRGFTVVGVVGGIEMDVIDVQAGGVLTFGSRMHVAHPKGRGARYQQEPQENGNCASHPSDYRGREHRRQARASLRMARGFPRK
jgi:hypothetical protein